MQINSSRPQSNQDIEVGVIDLDRDWLSKTKQDSFRIKTNRSTSFDAGLSSMVAMTGRVDISD